ncbi:hypothetical protein BDV93DRAFT_549408 [Ceratobasidium sp. AG-I]|nr:hypothetical protein BDV93DRAFT_549408 [Ceratobasidium sp. AG-I]
MPPKFLDHRVLNLSNHLSVLPQHLSDHPSVYPFSNFTLSPHDIEHYGRPQSALNHQLELVFGSRHGSGPIQFRGRGPSLLAVVDVLDQFISGETGENVLLWKWVEDLTHASGWVFYAKAPRTPDGSNCGGSESATFKLLISTSFIMSALPVGLDLGVPSFLYTMKKGLVPKQDYSVQDIQSAVQILTASDPASISEATLEAILDLVYYPEHLGLVVNTRVTSSLFAILMCYPEGESVLQALSFSLGYLLFQCLALATSVGLLAQHGKLAAFVESMEPAARETRTDVSPSMSAWLMDMINEDISNPHTMLTNIKIRLGWTLVGEEPFCLLAIGGYNYMSALYLLVHSFMGQNATLNAYTVMPALGWPVLLLVMWAQVRSAGVEERLLFMTKLRETVFRYCLVSAPSEHLIMQALVDDFANLIPPHEKHPPPLDMSNASGFDATNIIRALVQQLLFRQASSTSAGLKYLSRLTEYALQVLANPGPPRSFALIEALFDRLWHEIICASDSLDRDFSEHVMLFAIYPLHVVVKHFAESDSLERLPFGIGMSLVPQIIDPLVKIDIVCILGRLLLLPTASISAGNGSSSIAAATINEVLGVISQVTPSLSRHRLQTRPAFSKGYLDRLKTFNCMNQLQWMSMRQGRPLYPFVKESLLFWTQLGRALGYSEQTQLLDANKHSACPAGSVLYLIWKRDGFQL